MAQTGDYRRKRNKVGEIAVMEDGHGSVLTTRAMEIMSSASSFKRRKMESNVDDQLVNNRYDVNSPENSVSPATSEASDRITVSHCSSNESTEFAKEGLRSVDLMVETHAEGFETEMSTPINCSLRETTPSSELSADTDELESSTATNPPAVSLRRKHPAAKMPSATEIEEFFSAAEKYEQKLFADKYNYDIAKDVPLEGRYQWVRLKP